MFVNLTPHEIKIPEAGIILPPSGKVARCVETTVSLGTVEGIPLVNKEYGQTTDLPPEDPECETIYIVSAMVRQALPQRRDLASPGDLIRNSEGLVIGCRNLVVNGER